MKFLITKVFYLFQTKKSTKCQIFIVLSIHIRNDSFYFKIDPDLNKKIGFLLWDEHFICCIIKHLVKIFFLQISQLIKQ